MAVTMRPRRSVLYMPSSNERALEKAKAIACDAIIFDLEDAVSPDAKDQARANACAAVGSGEYGQRELIIRVNGIGTQWHDADMVAAVQAKPDVVLVPKVNSAAEVLALVKAMEAAGVDDKTSLWGMLETPIAMLSALEICSAHDRLTGFVMGTNDLNKELGALHVPGRLPMITGLSLCLLAARATGKVIVDGVYNDVKDPEGFAAECRQGREMGFDGKTLIHPGQVEACNEAYSPSAKDVEDAQGLIAAFEAAMAEGKGVATYNNRLIENLHVETAKKVLALDEQIKAMAG